MNQKSNTCKSEIKYKMHSNEKSRQENKFNCSLNSKMKQIIKMKTSIDKRAVRIEHWRYPLNEIKYTVCFQQYIFIIITSQTF